jgi:plastocyanin
MHGNASGLIVVTGEPVKNEPKEIEIDIVEKDPNDQQSWGFDPKSINIETGTTVTWRNTGAMTHTATAKDGTFDSGDIGPGKTYSYTFKKAGTYEYNCSPHPWMTGTIKVHEPGKDAPPAHHSGGSSSGSGSSSGGGSSSTGSSSGSSTSASGDEDAGPSTFDVSIVEPDAADPDSWGFDPSDLQVQVGDTVVWTNQGSTDHTVTAEGGAFDSGMIGPGDTFEYTFDEVGTFSYHCDPHPWMKGTVKVSEAPPPPGQGPSGAGSSGGSGSHSMDDMAGGDAATTASGDDVTSAAAETTSTEAALAAEQASSSIRDIPKTVASIASVVFVMSVAGAFILGRWWAQYMQSKGGAASA